jgi:hypothetical protein
MAMSNMTFSSGLGLFLLFRPRKAAFKKYRGFPVREFQGFIKTPTSPLSERVAPFQAGKAGEVVISADPFASVLWLLARRNKRRQRGCRLLSVA